MIVPTTIPTTVASVRSAPSRATGLPSGFAKPVAGRGCFWQEPEVKKRKMKLSNAIRRIIAELPEPIRIAQIVEETRRRFRLYRRNPRLKMNIERQLNYMRYRGEITTKNAEHFRTENFTVELKHRTCGCPVRANGIEYPSLIAAARAHGLPKNIINYIAQRCEAGFATKYGIHIEYIGEHNVMGCTDDYLMSAIESVHAQPRIVIQCASCGYDKPDDLPTKSKCPKCSCHRWERTSVSPLAA